MCSSSLWPHVLFSPTAQCVQQGPPHGRQHPQRHDLLRHSCCGTLCQWVKVQGEAPPLPKLLVID